MKLRKITSLTGMVCFVLLIITSVVMYMVPHGRVAYWAQWRLWGLGKEQWADIHINLGILLLISVSLHIYYNWTAIVSYLKNRARHIRVLTVNFNVAVLISAVFVFGTYAQIPPFVWMLDLNAAIKDAASRKYGEPPYGHAELSSLRTFTQRMGLDLTACIDRLRAAGYPAESPAQTIQDIAKKKQVSPQQVYIAMKPETPVGKPPVFPDTPPPGFGNRTVAEICHEFRLNVPETLKHLKAQGLEAGADMTLRQIAQKHRIHPIKVFEALKKPIS